VPAWQQTLTALIGSIIPSATSNSVSIWNSSSWEGCKSKHVYCDIRCLYQIVSQFLSTAALSSSYHVITSMEQYLYEPSVESYLRLYLFRWTSRAGFPLGTCWARRTNRWVCIQCCCCPSITQHLGDTPFCSDGSLCRGTHTVITLIKGSTYCTTNYLVFEYARAITITTTYSTMQTYLAVDKPQEWATCINCWTVPLLFFFQRYSRAFGSFPCPKLRGAFSGGPSILRTNQTYRQH